MTVEERTYTVLKGTAAITDILAGGQDGIYKDNSPDAGSYPVLVYKVISVVPHQHADNRLTALRSTVRITIITTDGTYSYLSFLIFTAMEAAGFVWQSSYDDMEGTKFYKIMHFIYAEEVTK